jgi:DNA segregation ATPase FtsK/SpoIIIE-like protein
MAEDLINKIEQGVNKSEKDYFDSREKTNEDQESFDIGFEKNEDLAEKSFEKQEEFTKPGEGFSSDPASATIVNNQKKEREVKIEEILSVGLDDIFLNLSPQKQEEFKVEGEKAVSKISILLDKAKINVEKVIDIIKKWLSIIPKVNKFFLEQEAKIKADQIIKLKK